jgi:hypothetical protein
MQRTYIAAEEPEPEEPPEEGLDDDDWAELSDMADSEDDPEGLYSDDPMHRIENADLDNVLDELVDVINGRDMDGLAELLAANAEAGFLDSYSRDEVVSGFNDLLFRNPTMILTRADYGSDPIAALWVFDSDADSFDPFGYMTLEVDETDEGLIERLDLVDEVENQDDLVVELPDKTELPEWWDWSQLDED